MMKKITRGSRRIRVSGEIEAMTTAKNAEITAMTPTWWRPVMPIDATIGVTNGKMTDETTVGILGKMIGVEVPVVAAAIGHLEWPTYHQRSS